MNNFSVLGWECADTILLETTQESMTGWVESQGCGRGHWCHHKYLQPPDHMFMDAFIMLYQCKWGAGSPHSVPSTCLLVLWASSRFRKQCCSWLSVVRLPWTFFIQFVFTRKLPGSTRAVLWGFSANWWTYLHPRSGWTTTYSSKCNHSILALHPVSAIVGITCRKFW